MSEAGFIAPMQMPRNNAERAQYGTDASLFVTFSKEAIFMEHESEKMGKAVYKDFDYIHIVQAGGKSDIKRQVRLEGDGNQPSDPERFPRQWAAFQRQAEQSTDGTPLEMAAFMPKAEIMNMKARGILSIEQLAGVSDGVLHDFGMGARKWRDMAKAYVDNATASAPVTEMAAQIEALRSELAALKALKASNTEEEGETTKRGPGRPRKED